MTTLKTAIVFEAKALLPIIKDVSAILINFVSCSTLRECQSQAHAAPYLIMELFQNVLPVILIFSKLYSWQIGGRREKLHLLQKSAFKFLWNKQRLFSIDEKKNCFSLIRPDIRFSMVQGFICGAASEDQIYCTGNGL